MPKNTKTLLRQYSIAATRVSIITAIEEAVDNSSSRVAVNHSHSNNYSG